MDEITIDPEFKALIPPLSPEERQQLELNLVESGGARDALVVWPHDGRLILLDGHNRYEICTALGLDFTTWEMDFDSREEASDWIDRNQLGRRNLSPQQASLLRGRRYNRVKKPNDGSRGNQHTKATDKMSAASAEAIAAQHGVDEKTIRRDGKFAKAAEDLGIESEIISGEIEATKQEIVAAAEALPKEPSQEDIQRAVESIKSKPHVANNSGDNEWYTPEEYIIAAKEVLGGIDLDPASNPVANEIVGARQYYSAEDNGLAYDWSGNVWMNPPYESGLIGQFAEKLCHSYSSKSVSAAIVLVNNGTETKWFQRMAETASAICFPKGRVKFWHPRKVAVPLQGQAVLYFGPDSEEFIHSFSQFGVCLEVAQ